MKTFYFYASYIIPGTNVFYGDPLIKEQPSNIVAAAKMVEGEISWWLFLIASNKFSVVSWIPGINSQNLSVLAVHKTIILSHLFSYLKSFMCYLIVFKCYNLSFPGIILSALSS